MKGVLFLGDRKVVVKNFPDPKPGHGQVVVQVKASGICGSDLHWYRKPATELEQDEAHNKIPGHEGAGIVSVVGDGVSTVKIGDRVAVYHYLGCGHCKHCYAGNFMYCKEKRGYGWHVNGPDADYLLTDERNCLPLPSQLSFSEGAGITCYIGTTYTMAKKLGISGLHTVVIFGLGPIGLASCLFAKTMGAKVIGVDVRKERVEIASGLGIDVAVNGEEQDVVSLVRDLTNGEGANRIIETSGNAIAQKQAIDCAEIEAKIGFLGLASSEPTMNKGVINPHSFIIKPLTLIGSLVFSISAYWEIVDFLLKRKIPMKKTITHEFNIMDAPKAFKLADSQKTGKVVFIWP